MKTHFQNKNSKESKSVSEGRRQLLRWIAASPLLTGAALADSRLENLLASLQLGVTAETNANPSAQNSELITSADQALNVFDFEPVARKNLPPAHFGHLVGGVDDDGTVRANRDGFTKFQIRPRRLVNVEHIDTSVRLLGGDWKTPIALAPAGSQKAYHPDGEIPVAKATQMHGNLQILSTSTSAPLEAVIEARGAPLWFQLYPTNVWEVTRALVKRAESAGCPVLVLTVDVQGAHNRETRERFIRMDHRDCEVCHGTVQERQYGVLLRRKTMFRGLDTSHVTDSIPDSMNWSFIKRLRDLTSMKLVIKGIVTREDAHLAVENGVNGIIVSNHGGRGENSGRSTIESLPEVAQAIAGRIPVLIDGGFRRGTDIFKAFALGANAIAIGRPYLYGLAAFGQPGVEAVLTILQRELRMIMQEAGTTTLSKITRAYVQAPGSTSTTGFMEHTTGENHG
jgi:isopentenyl diphosphate isomerase/L-lactate dehydrogenase-like FMN-dependent dehydrogenase